MRVHVRRQSVRCDCESMWEMGADVCLSQEIVGVVTACAAANANQLRLARDCPQERLLEGAQLLRVRAGREQGGGGHAPA